MRFDPHPHLIITRRGSRDVEHVPADLTRLLLGVTGLAAARTSEDQC
jgi:hypothetical protein